MKYLTFYINNLSNYKKYRVLYIKLNCLFIINFIIKYNMNDKLDRLEDIKIENFVWIIYIGIIILSWYANSKETKFILYDDEKAKKEYQNIMILIFTILVIIYCYFTKDSYDDLMNLNESDTEKKKILHLASFIGSFLVLISGFIFLGIVIVDDEIDTEIAFN